MAITSFTITNSTEAPIEIAHEPEGTVWEFPVGEKITIAADACENNISISTFLTNGKVYLGIWGDNSPYTVYYKGENLF